MKRVAVAVLVASHCLAAPGASRLVWLRRQQRSFQEIPVVTPDGFDISAILFCGTGFAAHEDHMPAQEIPTSSGTFSTARILLDGNTLGRAEIG